jgi:hypothetical protein
MTSMHTITHSRYIIEEDTKFMLNVSPLVTFLLSPAAVG